MKFSKILLSAAMLAGSLTAFAQEEVTEYTYNPNWYIQGQFGSQYTLGEIKTGKLMSPNAQIAAGYNFNPYFGLRLAVNAWQSRAGSNVNGALYSASYRWKWNYIAPTVDAVVDLTNVFGGYRPNRLVDVHAFLGAGVNIGFHNNEANRANADYVQHMGQELLGNLWNGCKPRFVGQFGADINFNVSKSVAVGLEVMANFTPDGYNSKKAGNADWYFNALAGVRYTFGPKYTATTRVIPAPEPQIIERVIEKVVEVQPAPAPVVVEKVVEQQEFRRDVFFKISTVNIVKDEMTKVAQVAEYMKENPDSKVVITGYADKGTGTLAINLRLSKQRAQAVANALKTKYGIPASRITVNSMGEAEDQPYSDPVDNRVAICVVK